MPLHIVWTGFNFAVLVSDFWSEIPIEFSSLNREVLSNADFLVNNLVMPRVNLSVSDSDYFLATMIMSPPSVA